MRLLRYVVVMLSVTASSWAVEVENKAIKGRRPVVMTSTHTVSSVLFGWNTFQRDNATNVQDWSKSGDLSSLQFTTADGNIKSDESIRSFGLDVFKSRIRSPVKKIQGSPAESGKQPEFLASKHLLERATAQAGLGCVATGFAATVYAGIFILNLRLLGASDGPNPLIRIEKPDLLVVGKQGYDCLTSFYSCWNWYDKFMKLQDTTSNGVELNEDERTIIAKYVTKKPENQVLFATLRGKPSSEANWKQLPTVEDLKESAAFSHADFLRQYQREHLSQGYVLDADQAKAVLANAKFILANKTYPHSFHDRVKVNNNESVFAPDPLSSTLLGITNRIIKNRETYKPKGLYSYMSGHWKKAVDGQEKELLAWSGPLMTALKPALFEGAGHVFSRNMTSLPPYMYSAKRILTSGTTLSFVTERSIDGAKIGVAGAKQVNQWLQKQPWWQERPSQREPVNLQQSEQTE